MSSRIEKNAQPLLLTWRGLSTRFIMIGAVLSILLLVVGVVSVVVSHSIQNESYVIRADAVPGSIDARAMQAELTDNFSAACLLISHPTPQQKEVLLKKIADTDKSFEDVSTQYPATMLIDWPADETQWRRLQGSRSHYLWIRGSYLRLLSDSQEVEAAKLLHGELLEAYRMARRDSEDLLSYNQNNTVLFASRIASEIAGLRTIILAVIILSIGCGLYLTIGLWIRRKEALLVSEQVGRFAIATNLARVVLWVRDFETSKIEWTDLIDSICGFELGAAPRTIDGWLAIIHPDEMAAVKKSFEAYRNKQIPFDLEYRVIKKNGEVIWIRDTGSSDLTGSRRTSRMYGAFQDISELKKAELASRELENQLRHSQKLEAVGTLAGGIAHDFNNLLTGINGSAEMALMDLKSRAAPPSETESLETILMCGHRARDLVAQILAFSRRQDIRKEPTDLSALVSEVIKLLRSTTKAESEIKVQISPNVALVNADATQLHQVILNLCTNAVYAMRGGNGVLEVKLDTVLVDADFLRVHANLQPGTHVRISVSDTGHGIDPLTLKRIFEPFFTTKPKGEGTGLGLAVVHGIVREHGGNIYPYSKVGEGTIFHVYLPALSSTVHESQVLEGESPMGRGERILLVDDEGAIGQVAANMLTRNNYSVRRFENPVEALRAFQDNLAAFDLVITDLQMPEMTGVDLATAVRRLRPDIPILLMSGFVGQTSVDSFRQIGLSEVLIKPLSVASVTRAVNRVLKLSSNSA